MAIWTAAEAVAAASEYAGSIAGGVIERDRSGNVPVSELRRLTRAGCWRSPSRARTAGLSSARPRSRR